MTAYINKLKDVNSNQQLPVTHERAVRDDNGTTAETKFQNLEGAMDKAYVANSDNGMGRITLHKNMVSGVNTLTQSMMQATNTIYVIRYDFTLGENITVPENCILEFDGGSLSGGALLGSNGNGIIASNYQIFKNTDVKAEAFNVEEVLVDWFYDGDLGEAISKCCIMLPNNMGTVKASSKRYDIYTPAKIKSNTDIDFNDAVINVRSSIPVLVDFNYGGETDYSISNCHISNATIKLEHKPSSDYYTIDIANCANSEIRNIWISKGSGYSNVEETDKFGIRIGRKTTNYSGTRSCNTVDNCFCGTIEIMSRCNEGTISNCKLWASDYVASLILNTSYNWIFDNNQFVGGSKGAIYLSPNNSFYNARFTNNYFDGSYATINTHDGILSGSDTEHPELSTFVKCIITNNLFWQQKERAINIKAANCIISNNVFDNNDYYNYGLEDINIDVAFTANIISGNIFFRTEYVTPNGATHPRITEDTEQFTRPAPIKIIHGYSEAKTIIVNNGFRNPNVYNKVNFSSSDRTLFVAENNGIPIPDIGHYGTTSEAPSDATRGYGFYNLDLNQMTFNAGSVYINALGYTPAKVSGTTANRPTNLQTYDKGFQFFDTTLNKPIYWTGSAWVDATGATV